LAERDLLRAGTGRNGRSEDGVWHRPAALDLISDILLFLAAIALAWAFVAWLTSRPFFPLREVVVITPPGQVTSAQIEYATRSSINGNFFTVGLSEVRDSLEKLPWVRRAEVRRRWPDALELRLEEHRAAAYWHAVGSDEVHLVNNRGEVFVATSDAGLPSFSGPQGSAAYLFRRHGEFAQLIEPLGRELSQVKLSARDAWELELDDGLVILLGRDRERAPVAGRLADFVRNWSQASERVGVDIAIADVRYQRGFALTPAASSPDSKVTQ
jgi:cell division protein FtsQ